jgi:hypothetical protein
MEFLKRVERFGLEAVTGRRQFYHAEYKRMIYAENIVIAYKSRAREDNWAAWAMSNPAMASILADAEKIANG